MARKLTEEQKAEIRPRYEQGESTVDLARCFLCSKEAIRKHLASKGCARRTKGSGLLSVSPDALYQAYWGGGSGLPSRAHLARAWGVSSQVITRRLVECAIPIRDRSAQYKADFQYGRRTNPNGGAWTGFVPPKPTPELSRQNARRGAHKLRKRVKVPCSWCAAILHRTPSRLKLWSRFFCGYRCRGSFSAWSRFHPSEPRRLVLDRLREILESPGFRRHSRGSDGRSIESMYKAGATIGATDAEYAEIMVEWAQG